MDAHVVCAIWMMKRLLNMTRAKGRARPRSMQYTQQHQKRSLLFRRCDDTHERSAYKTLLEILLPDKTCARARDELLSNIGFL